MMNSEWRIANYEGQRTARPDRALDHRARAFHSLFAIRYSLFLSLGLALVCANTTIAQTTDPDPQQEREELSKRLIRQATGQEESGLMGRIMSLMSEAAGHLKRDFDPGQDTQRVQREIIERLDEAIAAAQRRRSRGSGQQQQTSDKRRAPNKSDRQKQDQQPGDADAPPEDAASAKGQDQAAKSTATGRLREFRRGWGNLPQRDRDEVLQGIDEDILEKSRRLIENYFRALAEDQEE